MVRATPRQDWQQDFRCMRAGFELSVVCQSLIVSRSRISLRSYLHVKSVAWYFSTSLKDRRSSRKPKTWQPPNSWSPIIFFLIGLLSPAQLSSTSGLIGMEFVGLFLKLKVSKLWLRSGCISPPVCCSEISPGSASIRIRTC